MGYIPINYSMPNDGLGDSLRDAFIQVDDMFSELFQNKVDKVTGKGLTSNDFTDLEKTKLDGIESGAEVNVQSDLSQDDETEDDFVKGKDTFLFETFPKIQFTADGTQTDFDLVTEMPARSVFWNGALLDDTDWSQSANILTLTFTPALGDKIKPI